MGKYQRLNQELGQIDRCFPVRWIGNEEAKEIEVSAERHMLESLKQPYDDSKERFRVGFVQTLQKLIAVGG